MAARDGGIPGKDQAAFGCFGLQPFSVGGVLRVEVIVTNDRFANGHERIGHLVPAQAAIHKESMVRTAHAARRLVRTTSSITSAGCS